jgi:ATP-dependent DNA ligase
MEAISVTSIPEGNTWQHQPKWDGFRCLASKDRDQIELQSKSGKLLTRCFLR